MPRLVGLAKAKELIYTGKVLNPTEALQIGLVNRVSSSGSFDEAVNLAKEILPQGKNV